MKKKIAAAAFLVAMLPLGAQAQKPPKPTKAAAQQVVKLISGDQAKLKTYCEMGKLDEQIAAAEKKKDDKTVDALSKKLDAMAQQLGPEYVSLMTGLQNADPNSKDVQEIGQVLGELEKHCGK